MGTGQAAGFRTVLPALEKLTTCAQSRKDERARGHHRRSAVGRGTSTHLRPAGSLVQVQDAKRSLGSPGSGEGLWVGRRDQAEQVKLRAPWALAPWRWCSEPGNRDL